MQQTNNWSDKREESNTDNNYISNRYLNDLECDIEILKSEIERSQKYSNIPRLVKEVENKQKKYFVEKNNKLFYEDLKSENEVIDGDEIGIKDKKEHEGNNQGNNDDFINNNHNRQLHNLSNKNITQYRIFNYKKLPIEDFNSTFTKMKNKLQLAQHYYNMATQFPLFHLLKNTKEIKTIEEIQFAKEEKKFIKFFKKYKKLRKKNKIEIKNTFKHTYNTVLEELKNKHKILFEDKNIQIYKIDKNTTTTPKQPELPEEEMIDSELIEKYNKYFEKSQNKSSSTRLTFPLGRKNNIIHSSFHNTLSKISPDVSRYYTPLDISGIKILKKMEKNRM
ncbi:hypothetical protein SLOPH_2366 [Spraguea lophii 42_110]|uniref:Uncharacterized protein n=1 Tax=Spraguea lophii (strain 42_110) TaxID=1358809 RepID=S7W560_SPRLO|nr:hypothetical protein SLOPH_2366 [Spraguea lophii 42_110]